MANVVVTKVEVLELTKFGFKDGTGAYVGWSKQLKDSEKTPVVPGRQFEMELYVADSGKKYVNKILKQLDVVQTPVTDVNPPIDVARAKRVLPVAAKSEDMTRADWDAKDRRISRQGVIQAAVQALASVVTLDALFHEADLLATEMLEFVNRK